MKKYFPILLFSLLLTYNATKGREQNQLAEQPVKTSGLTSELCQSLELRALGPAVAAGRVSDIAIDPRNRNIWYVSFASSGLWKTTNRGITWTPIFDDGGSSSVTVTALGEPAALVSGVDDGHPLQAVRFRAILRYFSC